MNDGSQDQHSTNGGIIQTNRSLEHHQIPRVSKVSQTIERISIHHNSDGLISFGNNELPAVPGLGRVKEETSDSVGFSGTRNTKFCF